MKVDLRVGGEEIEVVDRDTVLDFRGYFHGDERAVSELLQRQLSDPVNLASMRQGLIDLGVSPGLFRLAARELAQELARMVAQGRIEIRRPRPRAVRRAVSTRPAEQPARTSPPPPASEPAPPPPAEEPVAAEVDPVAQAEVLAAASASGAPFCES